MKQGNKLDLDRCPHCGVANPYLQREVGLPRKDCNGHNPTFWGVYGCLGCGGILIAKSSGGEDGVVEAVWPSAQAVPEAVPERARCFLTQAIASVHAPAGAVMLSSSAVDAMLKDRGHKAGSLYKRIDEAAEAHLITKEMAAWAHEVRLDANDQRHADEEAPMATLEDAKRIIEFANALAHFLFVLPAMVARGRRGQQPGLPAEGRAPGASNTASPSDGS